MLVALVFGTPLAPAEQTTAPVSNAASAVSVVTNQPAKNVPTPLPGLPITPEKKRKAGFLAGAGLAILSLLALAAGLALVRTFKR
jgi:hypothetical protein